jgi:3-methyladenine DNA glycosylase/8-oxoguanine DNA glycosylase
LAAISDHRIKEGVVPSSLRVVRSASFVPRGGRYDPKWLSRRPVRALRGGDRGIAVAFRVRGASVAIDVCAGGPVTDDDVDRAMVAARGMAAVDDDPSAFVALVRGHPVLAELARRHDARLPRTPTLFESFTIAVLEQLVTTWEAWAAFRRLTAVASPPIAGTNLRAAPTPEGVLTVPMWKLRAIGVGSRRAVTLHDGARRGAAIERLRELAPEVVIEKLTSLRGVGPWTANAVARSALGWSDAVPIGDLHAPRLVTEALTGVAGDDAAMVAALEPFRPHRARVVKLLQMGAIGERPPPRVDRHRRVPWAT